MIDFAFSGLPWRVFFGNGSRRHLPSIIDELGFGRVLILSTPGRAAQLDELDTCLGGRVAAHFADAAPHVPTAVVDAAMAVALECGADCSVSLGGGSTTGLGKALRRKAGLPQVAIPTTFAGSEMTDIWGITEEGVKRTGRDRAVLPVAAVYDPELLVTLPRSLAGPSAMNALAQAVANVEESTSNPLAALLAGRAISILVRELPGLLADPADAGHHGAILHGAMLAGASLGVGGSGLHHRLCHVLGGMFSLPHAETHGIILPYSVSRETRRSPRMGRATAVAMGVPEAAAALFDLMRAACPRHSLAALGLPETGLPRAAEAVAASPLPGGGTVTRGEVLDVLRAAYAGVPPDPIRTGPTP